MENKHNLWVLIGIMIVMGITGATAKFMHDAGRGKVELSFNKWLTSTFVGTALAVFVGLTLRYFALPDEVVFGLCGLAAISSKEIIEALPDIITNLTKRLGGGK